MFAISFEISSNPSRELGVSPRYRHISVSIAISGSLTPCNHLLTVACVAVMTRGADYGGRCANISFGIRESWWSDYRETFYVQLQDFFVGNIDAETMLTNWQNASNEVISAALASE